MIQMHTDETHQIYINTNKARRIKRDGDNATKREGGVTTYLSL
jgi:hypothetical protein